DPVVNVQLRRRSARADRSKRVRAFGALRAVDRARGVEIVATKLNTAELLDVFKNMTVLELNEFLKAFEDEFGVTAAAPVAVAAGPSAGGGGEAAQAEEQDEIDVDRKSTRLNSSHVANSYAVFRLEQ